mmetsp:Transcript_34320/g.61617  ORF Transcript_34320/g.61617 Transcript_34320/m.61617 type:complete len:897 (-) Transcript_34320:68-2758(-)
MSKPLVNISTCKCVKSKCLMLYCECYRQGITCNDDCVCIDCKNTKEHARAKKSDHTNQGNTNATGSGEMDGHLPAVTSHLMRRDRALDKVKLKKGSGCSCKNSNCLKKYCVCFNAGIECNVGRCKCIDCKNPLGAISNHNTQAAAAAALFSIMEVPGAIRTAENTKCRCTKTYCLKLYCDCFRQDLICNSNCECIDCKNAEEDSGPTGERTRAKEEIMKTRPHVFQTPKKKSGGGCSCLRNKCRTKYCDCNSRGVGCDPAVCTCINCENMMKPLSEMLDNELEQVDEDETEVFIPNKVGGYCNVKGLQHFSHLINDFEQRRISEPSEKVNIAYIGRESAAETAKKVMDEESKICSDMEEEIKQFQAQLEGKIKKENQALGKYRQKTNNVMCLEMEEPCRWNDTYKQLKDYVMKTGDLPPVPSACTTEIDRKLSICVQEMKSLVYSKSERIINAPHRIEALESLGIEWVESSEGRWNKMYERLLTYKRQHKTVRLPSFMQCRKSKDKDLGALRRWVDVQGQEVASGAMAKRRDRLKKLQELGLPLKLTWEEEWEHYMVELLKFRSKYGHLDVSGNAASDLTEFVTQVLNRLKKNGTVKLTEDELYDLKAKGLMGDLKSMSRPIGRPPSGGKQAESMKLVPLERVKEVNYWAGMLEQLKAYQAEHNTLNFPGPKGSGKRGGGKYAYLCDWVEAQRQNFENKTLEESRIKELSKLGLEFDPWNVTFNKLKKFKREAGTVRLPKEYKCSDEGEKDEEIVELCKWVQEQIRLYRKSELEGDKKKKLRKLGVYLTKGHMGKMPWEDRFEEMMEYYHSNKTCLPKRDGPLRQWVLELVQLIQDGFVSQRRQKLIEEERIGPYLRPEVIFKGSTAGNKKRKAASAPSDDVSDDDKKPKTIMAEV